MPTLEELLRPLDGDSPAGPDLTYDGQRQEIERAFEAAAGVAPGTADSTDWRQIVDLILDQGGRTRDMWLPIYLARAGARANRLETVELGCLYLAGLLENFWPTMHPSLEDYGFPGRKGPCESLVRIGEFLGPLRRMVLVAHPRLGSFTADDFDRFAREGEAAENYGSFRAAIGDIPQEELQATVERLDRIRDAIARVDAILSANANGDTGTNFTPTYAALDAIRRGVAQYSGAAEPASGEAQGESPAADGAQAQPGGPAAPGRIDSREDVLKALDAVVDYYRRREPTSPVPVAIARAKNWVNMDFLSVLEDIAPDSLAEARRVLAATGQTDG